MQRPSLGLTVLLGALAVPVLVAAAGRVYQSNDAQRAKAELAHTQAAVREDRDALAAHVREQREDLEADAEARQDKVEAHAEREIETLQADTRAQQAALDQAANEKQQRLDDRLDAAAQPAEAAAHDVREGTITSINAATGVVTIREPESASGPLATAGSPVTPLFVAAGAPVEHEGRALSLRDVQVGDRVQLQLGDASGRREVQRILIVARVLPGSAR